MIRSMGEESNKSEAPVDEGTILLMDKPFQWTSFDVVHKVRRTLGIPKVGHTGTLDPRATGLLIICTGRQTKRVQEFADMEKEYTGTLQLGIRTPSFDLETAVTEQADISTVTQEKLAAAVQGFLGKQLQVPPMFSAVKHHGKPLYKYARKGKTLEREAKEIEIKEFSIISFAPPNVSFRVRCSKGTYIRTLANDLGEILGCGATLVELRRTRIGEYRVENALTISQFENLKNARELSPIETDEQPLPA
ncbi:MAG: tRNA pseudouridine(55) synthase TruB [Ignavibacteriales bacterium]|nr:tRNA pseudouridine(55) synthase TruB [Ignavibacteriales bacterium]